MSAVLYDDLQTQAQRAHVMHAKKCALCCRGQSSHLALRCMAHRSFSLNSSLRNRTCVAFFASKRRLAGFVKCSLSRHSCTSRSAKRVRVSLRSARGTLLFCTGTVMMLRHCCSAARCAVAACGSRDADHCADAAEEVCVSTEDAGAKFCSETSLLNTCLRAMSAGTYTGRQNVPGCCSVEFQVAVKRLIELLAAGAASMMC